MVELASVTVLVEAEDTPAELAGARIAQASARTARGDPGPRQLAASRAGTNALLMEGARLVRGPHDVLELLGSLGATPRSMPARTSRRRRQRPHAGLAPALRATLERVGAGCDTPDKLTRAGEDPAAVLLALSELELMGLLDARRRRSLPAPRAPAAMEVSRLLIASHSQELG